MGCEKSQEQEGGHKRGTEKQQQSSLSFIDGLMSSTEFGVGATFPEVQRKGCAWRRHAKDDSGAYAVLTEQGSSASQMTAAKVVDVLAPLPN